MNRATRLTYGTLKIEWGDRHTLTLGLALPCFLAEKMHGEMTPPAWDEALGEFLLRDKMDEVDWSGRFEFPAFNHELKTEGKTGRKGAGQLPQKPRLAKGKKDAAVRGRPGRGIGGCGVRELSFPYRGQKVPTGNAGKMALSGYVGRTTRKGAVSLVSEKW